MNDGISLKYGKCYKKCGNPPGLPEGRGWTVVCVTLLLNHFASRRKARKLRLKLKLMAKHSFPIQIDEGLFRGLANQNMLLHQCLSELVDNSIAAKRDEIPFRIDIIFTRDSDQIINLYIVDNSSGMDEEHFKAAMQPGNSATTSHRLNEHGFGLKHSLATLSKHTRFWQIWTKDPKTGSILSVSSPFKAQMEIDDDSSFPSLPYEIKDIRTVIHAKVTFDQIQSVQTLGKKALDINNHLYRLREHLGVTYRGYLSQDPNNDYRVDGSIFVSLGEDKKIVPPIEIPMEGNKTDSFALEFNGRNETIIYNTGYINDVKKQALLEGNGLKEYYQENISTQGIDIRLGKRVIATKQLNKIFGVDRHNSYNSFVGEIIIPELPRNVLKTVNNKTDIDFDDSDWTKLIEFIRENYPLSKIDREQTEEGLRKEWILRLKANDHKDVVVSDKHVWPPGVRIDSYKSSFGTNDITIYELKIGSAKPIDLYQLKMYWDGLVLNGEFPKEAWLICETYDTRIQEMATKMNSITIPDPKSHAYNFILKTLDDVGLAKKESRKGKRTQYR